MRCDDPLNLTSSGGEAAPTVQSTFVLNDIQVQVNPSGTSGWSLLRDYQLSYDQSAPTTVPSGATSIKAGGVITTKAVHSAASYDAAGDLTCRAATVATTCTGGSPTGTHLSYDAAGQLSHWQDQASAPNSTADYLYDGEGNRVYAQTSDSGGTTTTTAYVSNLEDVATTSGGTTTTTAYYYLAGKRVALSVNGAKGMGC